MQIRHMSPTRLEPRCTRTTSTWSGWLAFGAVLSNLLVVLRLLPRAPVLPRHHQVRN